MEYMMIEELLEKNNIPFRKNNDEYYLYEWEEPFTENECYRYIKKLNNKNRFNILETVDIICNWD